MAWRLPKPPHRHCQRAVFADLKDFLRKVEMVFRPRRRTDTGNVHGCGAVGSENDSIGREVAGGDCHRIISNDYSSSSP